MGFDVEEHLSAVERTVSSLERDGQPAFATSRDGKAFITGSSEGWGQAAVADGTNPKAGRAAAKRTTMFYTGESAEPD